MGGGGRKKNMGCGRRGWGWGVRRAWDVVSMGEGGARQTWDVVGVGGGGCKASMECGRRGRGLR